MLTGEASRLSEDAIALRKIKLLHTAVWAVFAGCIVAIPALSWAGELYYATLCALVVAVEVLVLVLNQWRCPLTDVAGRYTGDRRENFDIFLPEWLARHNKVIFGTMYVAGLIALAVTWLGT